MGIGNVDLGDALAAVEGRYLAGGSRPVQGLARSESRLIIT